MQAAPGISSAPALGGLTDQSLDEIQGNILAGFNGSHQAFLHFSFRNSGENARRWLAELVNDKSIASTRQVLEASEQTMVAVSFTSTGLLALKPDLADDLMNYRAFWDGAVADRVDKQGVRSPSPARIGDVRASEPSEWVVGGSDQPPIDVLMTIAAQDSGDGDGDDRLLRDRAAAEWERAISHDLVPLGLRQGNGLPSQGQFCCRLGRGVEHFGFKDGISQPSIRGFPPESTGKQAAVRSDDPVAAGEFVLGYEREKGAPAEKEGLPPARLFGGSFQVWARLNQDVPRWRAQMAVLHGSSSDGVDVAAKVIGRQQDGTPLADTAGNSGNNSFTYAGDDDGRKTPLFSHIRKVNPRRPGGNLHRLIRRGITYGPALGSAEVADDTERGLVFNAFMASIERQFEVIQRDWASSAQSISTGCDEGPDPVVGASDAACLLHRDDTGPMALNFEPFVWTTAAVYAFAPSIPTLAWLAGEDPDEIEA